MRLVALLSLLLVACAPGPAVSLPVGPPLPEPTQMQVEQHPGLGTPQLPPGPHILYLANEGLLLSSDGEAVLIDGLHRPYEPEYAVLEPEARGLAERAEGPFAAVELVLVSHPHRDHFDADAVRSHLSHNSDARLISSPQVVEAVTAGLPDDASIRRQIDPVPYAPGQSQRHEVGRIAVELIGLPHGSARFADVHNLAHIVTLAGVTLLHVGDASLDDPILAGLDLPARSLDVASLPYWYFLGEDGFATVQRLIGARRYYAVHIPPNDSQVRAELLRNAPKVIPLIDSYSQVPW